MSRTKSLPKLPPKPHTAAHPLTQLGQEKKVVVSKSAQRQSEHYANLLRDKIETHKTIRALQKETDAKLARTKAIAELKAEAKKDQPKAESKAEKTSGEGGLKSFFKNLFKRKPKAEKPAPDAPAEDSPIALGRAITKFVALHEMVDRLVNVVPYFDTQRTPAATIATLARAKTPDGFVAGPSRSGDVFLDPKTNAMLVRTAQGNFWVDVNTGVAHAMTYRYAKFADTFALVDGGPMLRKLSQEDATAALSHVRFEPIDQIHHIDMIAKLPDGRFVHIDRPLSGGEPRIFIGDKNKMTPVEMEGVHAFRGSGYGVLTSAGYFKVDTMGQATWRPSPDAKDIPIPQYDRKELADVATSLGIDYGQATFVPPPF